MGVDQHRGLRQRRLVDPAATFLDGHGVDVDEQAPRQGDAARASAERPVRSPYAAHASAFCSPRRGQRLAAAFEPVAWAKELESRGAGELLLTSIDREGTWEGFDLKLIKSVTDAVNVPVIAHGGAGSLDDGRAVVKEAGSAAVSLGSLVVFQKRGMGVLVNFPDKGMLEKILN